MGISIAEMLGMELPEEPLDSSSERSVDASEAKSPAVPATSDQGDSPTMGEDSNPGVSGSRGDSGLAEAGAEILAGSGAPLSDAAAVGEAGSSSLERVNTAVITALLAETDVPADQYKADLSLNEDFDLDTIGLYAVVASIEQDLKITMADKDVNAAQTLGDLLDVVRRYYEKAPR